MMYIEKNQEWEREWGDIEQKLRDIYFFTHQQISDVLKIYNNNNQNIVNNILDDVENQYKNIPSDVSANEYLYANLMSIEFVDKKKKQQEIIDNKWEILDSKESKVVSYMNFLPNGQYNHEEIYLHLENYLTKQVQDFFVIHIKEDIVIDKENKKDKEKITSELVKRYIWRSRWDGINFYVFVQKNGAKKIAIGTQKWTTWTSNDIFFWEIAKRNNVLYVTIPLSSFLKTK